MTTTATPPTSDLAPDPAATLMPPKKAAQEILQGEIREGVYALKRSTAGLALSGLSAGLDIGFSVLLMAVMWTQAHNSLAHAWTAILMGNMYAIGFILVVIGRSELFTEQTTLAVLPVLSGEKSVLDLLRLWLVVFVSNLVGAAIFAWILSTLLTSWDPADPAALGHIAHLVVDPSATSIFISAILAGWLMGLLSWLVTASRDTIGQIAIVWLITTAIGFCGLHHVVVGSVEVLAAIFSRQGITFADFFHFLPAATAGNIIGGSVFVAVIKYGHAHRKHAESNEDSSSYVRKDYSL